MRVYACKDLDGDCCIIRGTSEPKNPRDFYCEGKQSYVTSSVEAETYCTTLTPGTFRELKRLEVVSGEFEFAEEVKVPTLLEAWKAYKYTFPEACDNDMHKQSLPQWYDLCQALNRELSKPAPRYDEKLIDELLEIGPRTCVLFSSMVEGHSFSDSDNIRAAEILQELKRAKGEG